MKLSKEKILSKFLEEKKSAIKARQVRVDNWSLNEKLYNGVTTTTLLTRSNLHIPNIFNIVQTVSAKLGQLPEVEFDTKPDHDQNASDIMKSLWRYDLNKSDAETIAQNSKTEAGLYGRAVYKLIPANDGVTFELVDTMSFLINPTARGTKDALYCGQQFIYKTVEQLEKDMVTFGYDEKEIEKIKSSKEASETSGNFSQEKSLKDLRLSYLGYSNVSQLGAKMVELNEWYTIIDGEWYVLTIADDRYLLRADKSSDTGLERHPYVSWATYPRGVVFWTPSPADVGRDPNLAMDVSINQMIDNNTYRNFGMMFVSASSGLKQSSIVPRPLGVTSVNVGIDKSVKDSVWQFTPPEIGSAASTLSILSTISDNAVGLSANSIQHKGKLSVTQQAQQSGIIESKNNLLRQNYVKAWQEMGQLYADIISKKLTKPRKVKIYSNTTMTLEGVTKKNFEGIDFIVTASSQEISQENKAIKQKASIALYNLFKDDPKVPGQKFLREKVAKDFDLNPTDIEELFATDTEQTIGQTLPKQQNTQQPDIPTNPASPLLSQTAQNAQASVPNAIR